jgi:predicted acyl esterase
MKPGKSLGLAKVKKGGLMAYIPQEKNILIPLPDGVSLAADLYLPAGQETFPSLISYYPYHRDDFIGSAFEYARRYSGEQGYAHLLVDFPGIPS